MGLMRREILIGGAVSSAAIMPLRAQEAPADDLVEFIRQRTDRAGAWSSRVQLLMPAKFPNGYTVPMEILVDSPMTGFDHVRDVRVFAPRNPIVEVACFQFVMLRSIPHVSTRIRLAQPQYVVAVANMNDGSLLMAKAWVDVATNGCA